METSGPHPDETPIQHARRLAQEAKARTDEFIARIVADATAENTATQQAAADELNRINQEAGKLPKQNQDTLGILWPGSDTQ